MKPVRVPDLRAMKERGDKIAVWTAYDFTMARLLDRAGMDVILVGDSLGMVVLRSDNTLPVTLATNPCVPPNGMVAETGDTETFTGNTTVTVACPTDEALATEVARIVTAPGEGTAAGAV